MCIKDTIKIYQKQKMMQKMLRQNLIGLMICTNKFLKGAQGELLIHKVSQNLQIKMAIRLK